MKIAIPFLKKEKKPEKIFETPAMEAKDIIAPSSIILAPDSLRLGKKFAKSFFIFSYPRYLTTAWFSPIINLDTPMDIGFHIHPIETGLVLKQLRKKVTEVQSELMEREEKGFIRDPALEIAYRDLESLRDKLQTAQERMFKLGLYLTVYGDSQKELKDVETTLRSILEARLVYIKPALYQQKEGFHASSPSGLDQLSVHTPMNTGPLSSLFPFISFDLSSNEGILYGINMHNNSLILFDRFSLENAGMVIFAKAGSGKSILGSEPVLVKENGKISLSKIGPLIEKLIEKKGAVQIDEELEGVINPEVEVYSFDNNLKGNWSRATVAARKKAPNVFYRFATRSGREITTTADHNMLVLRDGKIIAAKSAEIKEGEHIPLPRKISESDSSLRSFNLLDLLKKSKGIYVKNVENLVRKNYKILHKISLDKKLDRYLYRYRDSQTIPIHYFWKILNHLKIKSDSSELKNLKLTSKNGKNRASFDVNFQVTYSLLKLLGYITAEGTVREDCVIISNADVEILKDIDSCLKDLGIPFYYGNRGVIIASRVFNEIVKNVGGKEKSGQKKVLPFVFNLRKAEIAQYLSAYFEGDGGIESNNSITATSKSKRLISEVSYLLYYFGVIGRIAKKRNKATNSNWKRKRVYYKLSITGQDNLKRFAENINFISQRKKGQLSKITQKEGNTNVDIIPGLDLIFQEIYNLFSFQLSGIPEISEWKRGVRHPSPQHLLKVINQIEQRIQNFKDSVSTYEALNDQREFFTTNSEFYPTNELKRIVHFGFKEMDLPMKYYNPSLRIALLERPKTQRDTSYEMIQKAAQFVWQNYQDVLINKIPQVEEKLTQLKILTNSDLFWDPIAKIKKIENKKEKYVYDLTVDNEVFLAGQGGMFIHNSYTVKLEILRSLMAGIDCIVIDPENEYRFLSDAIGGSFFNISLASPSHINPFDLPTPREDEKPEDVLRSNIINLVGLLRIMLGGLTPEEDAVLDRALSETYAAKDITPETDPSTWQERIPLMSDLEAVLEGMEGAESLVRRVRKFTQGTFAQFFNQPTNISMEKPFVVFGIRDLEDELRPIAMFIIMRYIWNKVRSELKKRILVVDEAWWLMQTEDGASFLFGIAKRARKYWLGVTTVTQDVNDFMKSSYGQPIITNSSLQLLMKQSPATIDIVQKTFNLTDEEKYLLLEADIGEGMFFAGQKHVAIKVAASYTEDQIITTAPEEVLKIKQAKKEI